MREINKSNQVRDGVEIVKTLKYKNLKFENKAKCTTTHTIVNHSNIDVKTVNR